MLRGGRGVVVQEVLLEGRVRNDVVADHGTHRPDQEDHGADQERLRLAKLAPLLAAYLRGCRANDDRNLFDRGAHFSPPMRNLGLRRV